MRNGTLFWFEHLPGRIDALFDSCQSRKLGWLLSTQADDVSLRSMCKHQAESQRNLAQALR